MALTSWLVRIGNRFLPPRDSDDPGHAARVAAVKQLSGQFAQLAKEATEWRREIRESTAQRAKAQGAALAQATSAHAADMRRVEARVNGVHASARRRFGRAERVLDHGKQQHRYADDEAMVFRRLGRIAAGARPIVAGPWTGDVALELAYWVPFLRWFAWRFRVGPERLHVISRGGAASLYEGISTHYTDVLSVLSPEEFRARPRSPLAADRVVFGAFDREILRRLRRDTGLRHPSLLHPRLMGRLFAAHWNGDVPFQRVTSFTLPRRLPRHAGNLLGLPPGYVAVRFAFNESFPDTPANRRAADETVTSLSASRPVVLLNPALEPDDQRDYRPAGVAGLVTPEQSLDLLSAVISRADAFVGSDPGLAFMAASCGVRSFTLYSRRSDRPSQKAFMAHTLESIGGGAVVTLDVANMALLRGMLTSAAHTPG